MEKALIFQMAMEIWSALFCLICALVIHAGKKTNTKSDMYLEFMFWINMLILASDIVAFLFDDKPGMLNFYLSRISNFLLFSTEYVLVFCVGFYLHAMITENGGSPSKIVIYINGAIQAAGLLGLIVTQWTGFYYRFDIYNTYHRGSGIYLGMGVGFAGIIVCMIFATKFRHYLGRSMYTSILSLMIVPGILLAVQLFNYGLSLINLGITFAIFFMFVVYEKERSSQITYQQNKISTAEWELMQSKNAKLVSQMKPYFIQNSLRLVRQLCEEDPKRAIQAIDYLNSYMRDVYVLMEEEKTITLERELQIVDYYIGIEELRFNGKIHVHKNIEDALIRVPPFAILPLMEFIYEFEFRKPGLTGNIWIKEVLDDFDGEYRITIRDDGYGCDINVLGNVDEFYEELQNASNRLDYLLNGVIRYEKLEQGGAQFTIRIPVGKDEKEDILKSFGE